MENYKEIVCLGGGTAMPKAVLAGLKKYPVKLSVISAVLDDGGSAGDERSKWSTSISYGDIRRAAYELSNTDKETREYLNSRLTEGQHKGHVVSNLRSSAIVRETGDHEEALIWLRKSFEIPQEHRLLIPTFDDATLCAELEDGTLIRKETNIDIPKHDCSLKIKKAFLDPPAKANPKVLESIKNSHLIVIGPGDLYSSLVQILLIDGIAESIKASKANIVYIVNAMTKHGETDDFSVLEMTNEIEKYLGGPVDYVVYNKNLSSKERIEKTKKANPLLVDVVKIDENLPKEKFIGENLLSASGLVVHDSQKLAKIILSTCKP